MKTKMIWANLAVSDLQRTTQFYSALGFKANGASDELTSFCFGEQQFIIHFFQKEKFDTAMNGMAAGSEPGREVIFSLSAETREEVDRCADEITSAGGIIIAGPQEIGPGYNLAFADPDGHKFNVLFWP